MRNVTDEAKFRNGIEKILSGPNALSAYYTLAYMVFYRIFFLYQFVFDKIITLETFGAFRQVRRISYLYKGDSVEGQCFGSC